MTSHTISISKQPAHERLQPGEPFQFIRDEPFRNVDSGLPAAPGDRINQVWDTKGEPGYVFKIVAVHLDSVYETVYVGRDSRMVSP